MAEFTITDVPRELTDAEATYLTSMCSDVIRRWLHEEARPSHVCRKAHGGEVIETADFDEHGKPARHPVTGAPTYSRAHALVPTCHDCGRGLVRPLGDDDRTWLCPNALVQLAPGKPDSAVECGEKR